VKLASKINWTKTAHRTREHLDSVAIHTSSVVWLRA